MVTKRDSNADLYARRDRLLDALRQCPIPGTELLSNLGLFIRHQQVSRMIALMEDYDGSSIFRTSYWSKG